MSEVLPEVPLARPEAWLALLALPLEGLLARPGEPLEEPSVGRQAVLEVPVKEL